jgi:glyoxylase-like metal-dependent hydrolase (beta-lactamase superfamily II)
MNSLRTVLAHNPSPMTLDGTRTFLVGRQTVAVIDPGPDLASHIDALAATLHDARSVAIILTHRAARWRGAGPSAGLRTTGVVRVPSEGDVIPTDGGQLVALATPGHTPDHVALEWPAESAIFCGDLMMGGMDSALVAAPEGNLTDYLASLDRLAQLAPTVLYPTHGPHFNDPARLFTGIVSQSRAAELCAR